MFYTLKSRRDALLREFRRYYARNDAAAVALLVRELLESERLIASSRTVTYPLNPSIGD